MDVLEIIVFVSAVVIVIFTVSYNLKRLLRGDKTCSGCGSGNCSLGCGCDSRKKHKRD